MKKYTRDEKILSWMIRAYIELIAKTSSIKCTGQIDDRLMANAILGFWHQDSMGMNFLLRQMQKSHHQTQIIVTADKRGNYIEGVIAKYGAKALRMPDGMRLRPFLQNLKEKAKEERANLCIALDGPLGPLHEPKKLGFMLAHEANKPCVLIKVEYTRKIHLYKRWDKYVIPLPFGKITFTAYYIEKVTKEDLRDFANYKQKIKDTLL